MGQKVNPFGFRLGVNKTWKSMWYSDKSYRDFFHQDIKIRSHIVKKFKKAAISEVVIERLAGKTNIIIHTSRPGVLIGKQGINIDSLKKYIASFVKGNISINLVEEKKPDSIAVLLAQNVAEQLEQRVSFRRAMRRVMKNATRAGVKGIKLSVAGRLGGAEIARTEWYREGQVPLQTLRSNIDYGTASAHTKYGVIGIKLWLYKGDILSNTKVKTV